jgi:hypothetical protein
MCYYVDFESLERTPKSSALWYKATIQINGAGCFGHQATCTPLFAVMQRMQSHVFSKRGGETMVGNQYFCLHFFWILLDEQQSC